MAVTHTRRQSRFANWHLIVIGLALGTTAGCTNTSLTGRGKKVAETNTEREPAPGPQANPQVDQQIGTQQSATSPAQTQPVQPEQQLPSTIDNQVVVPEPLPPGPSAGPMLPPTEGGGEISVDPDGDDSVADLRVCTTCFVNMEHGYHGTDDGYVAQVVANGRVIAAGESTIEGVRRGEPTDGDGAYPGLNLYIPMTFVDPAATGGAAELLICLNRNRDMPDARPENAVCEEVSGPFGGDSERPTSVRTNVNYSVSRGQDGRPLIAVDGTHNLSTHHPVWGFAKPGACFKDYQSPIVLDLDHDSQLSLIDVWDDRHVIKFDLNGDGAAVRTGWVGKGDGLLAIDSDGDGKISSGTELFGEWTGKADGVPSSLPGGRTYPHGYAALASYDNNSDGKIDIRDVVFSKLRVWRDSNSDGVSRADELSTMAEAGVESISLAYTKSSHTTPVYVNNNEVRLTGTFKATDGKEYLAADVWFRQRRYGPDTADTKIDAKAKTTAQLQRH